MRWGVYEVGSVYMRWECMRWGVMRWECMRWGVYEVGSV